MSWTDVLQDAKELGGIVRAAVGDRVYDVSGSQPYILGMFWRALRLYDGAVLLLERELPEEAAILARSLFEESLRLQQLAADAAQREALILGWVNDSITEKAGLLKEAKRVGLDDDPSAALLELQNHRRNLERFRDSVNVKKYARFADERTNAHRFGRDHDYWTYQWSHEAVHGSDAVWMWARRVQGNNLGLFARTNEPRILIALGAYAATSLTNSYVSTCQMFAWTADPHAEQIAASLVKVSEAQSGD